MSGRQSWPGRLGQLDDFLVSRRLLSTGSKVKAVTKWFYLLSVWQPPLQSFGRRIFVYAVKHTLESRSCLCLKHQSLTLNFQLKNQKVGPLYSFDIMYTKKQAIRSFIALKLHHIGFDCNVQAAVYNYHSTCVKSKIVYLSNSHIDHLRSGIVI